MFRSALLALVVFGLLATGANAQPQQAKVAATSSGSHELPPWRVPDIAGLPDDENGKLVRYGKDLIDHTWAVDWASGAGCGAALHRQRPGMHELPH